jgi:hypothetical protein
MTRARAEAQRDAVGDAGRWATLLFLHEGQDGRRGCARMRAASEDGRLSRRGL